MTSSTDPLQFISNSIGCFALSFLSTKNLLNQLALGQIEERFFEADPDQVAIRSAIYTLIQCKIIDNDKRPYQLTPLGKRLIDHISLIQMLLSGYGNLLVRSIVDIPSKSLVHDYEVAKASIAFGKNSIDPIVLEEIPLLHPKGTICDLGCGIPTRLISFCSQFGVPGLGIDYSKKTLDRGKKLIKRDEKVRLKRGDITNLKKIWRDVDIIMQYFVLHDITPASRCISVLQNYQTHFPNFRYFLYVDIVFSLTEEHMPGFDYIHGLQNIQTRSYEETIDLFAKASLTIYKEKKIEKLPSTYLWILVPTP